MAVVGARFSATACGDDKAVLRVSIAGRRYRRLIMVAGGCACQLAVRCCLRTELWQAGVEGAAVAGRRQQRQQLRQQREEGDQEVEDVPAVLPERAEGIDPLEACAKATRTTSQLRYSGQFRNKKP